MTTIEDRLKEIAEIDAKIEAITAYKEKKKVIEEKKESIEGGRGAGDLGRRA